MYRHTTSPPIMKVAYVEDDNFQRITVKNILKKNSIRCDTYPARNDFLRAVFENPPDAYILDGNFPIFYSEHPGSPNEFPSFLAANTVKHIRLRRPGAKIIVYSDDEKCESINDAVIVKKSAGVNKLVETVQLIIKESS